MAYGNFYGESCEPSQDEDHDDNPLQMLLESDIRQRVIDAIELLPERGKMVLTPVLSGRSLI